MAHFAEVINGIVKRVIVAEQDFIDSGAVGNPSNWKQTSYNTHGGIHKLGGTPLRKNYAGINYTYDEQRDAFIPPKPYPSWNLNESTCLWDSPIPYPSDGNQYKWDETTQSWDELIMEGNG
jgi:hypothetical protein